MGKVHIAPDLFLEKQELNRFQKFLDDDGYREVLRQQTTNFGLVRNKTIDPTFSNGQVEQGTNAGTIKIADIFAIDEGIQFLRGVAQDNIAINPDSLPYWVWIEYVPSSIETGVVSVSATGNLTGVGTIFTDVIRGGRTFPSKISFPNSVSNTGEYLVVDVVSDTIAQIGGQLVLEADLRYEVVGTFTSGVTPNPADKYPFRYDSAVLHIDQSGSEPVLDEANQFLLARVVNDGGAVTLEDYRRDFYGTRSETLFSEILGTDTNIFGIETVKFDSGESTRTNNLVEVAWGFRGSTFSFNPSLRLITIQTGQGGRYLSTTDVSDDDFNNWRVYFNANDTNEFATVVDTVIAGSTVELYLDGINTASVLTSSEALVVPAAEEILIKVTSDPASNIDLVDETFTFPINQAIAQLSLLVYGDPTALYNFTIAYKNVANYTPFMPIEDGEAYFESQFDASGNLAGGAARASYTADPLNGFITLTKAPDSFTRVVGGDVLGVTNIPYNNLSPTYELQPGATKTNVLFTTGDTAFSVGHLVILRTAYGLIPVAPEVGSTFYLQFTGAIAQGVNTLQIRQDYNNPGDPGTLLKNFTPTDFDWQRDDRRSNIFRAYFDGVNWQVGHTVKDPYTLGQVVSFQSLDLTQFDATGLGRFDEGVSAYGEFRGFALCNGQNGTKDQRKKFVIGADILNNTAPPDANFAMGDAAGSLSLTLTLAQMPSHNHGVTDPEHNHGLIMDAFSQKLELPGVGAPIEVAASLGTSFAGQTTDTLRYGFNTIIDGGLPATANSGTIQTSSVTSTGTIDGSATGITIDDSGSGDDITLPYQPYIALAFVQRVLTT